MKKSYSYFTLALLLIIFACNTPKSLTKKGVQLQNAGLYSEASDYFIQALQKNPKFVEAQIALKSCAEKVLDIKEDTFFVANNREDKRQVVYTYLDMIKYAEKVKSVGIDVSVASHYTEDFLIVKSSYLEDRFQVANRFLQEEKFSQAEEVFNEIIFLDPNYKDVESLKKYAHVEPIYRKGIEAVKREKYREAYYAFESVRNNQAGYKDSDAQLKEALLNAQYTIAFMHFSNLTYEYASAEQLSSRIINDVIQNKGPFIKVIDRDNLELLMKEQKLGMTGVIDDNTAAKTGNIIGAKAVVLGKVLEVKVNESPVSGATKKGFESYNITKIDPTTKQQIIETKFKKITYNLYTGHRDVSCTFQYKMISATTGEIILTGIKTFSQVSNVNYVSYTGSANNLHQGNWNSINYDSPQDVVYTDMNSRNNLQSLLNGNQILETKEALLYKVYSQISGEVAREIYTYNPEK